jgi:hypothetical protein
LYLKAGTGGFQLIDLEVPLTTVKALYKSKKCVNWTGISAFIDFELIHSSTSLA